MVGLEERLRDSSLTLGQMMPAFTIEGIQLFILFVVPGLISMSVYRMLMPARSLDWAHAVLQGLFYSSLNFAVLLPLVWWISEPENTFAGFRYWLAWATLLLFAPVVWPLMLRAAFKWRWFASRINVPYPTAWDYFFELRTPVFVLVHLKGDKLLGGYWGPSSYAGSFPNDGDIFLEAVYKVTPEGTFREPIPDTGGVLLRREQYDYIEIFKVPQDQEVSYARREEAS
jgi:hypothetical protein